jgi:hypothetical protein
MKTTHHFIAAVLSSAVLLASAGSAIAKDNILSLSNLERERSALIHDMLDPELAFEQRAEKLQKRQRQLTDMERMVMRDERLISSQDFRVKRAFSAYELTFLVHAGAEKQQSASSQWLEQINFDSTAVMNASASYK